MHTAAERSEVIQGSPFSGLLLPVLLPVTDTVRHFHV